MESHRLYFKAARAVTPEALFDALVTGFAIDLISDDAKYQVLTVVSLTYTSGHDPFQLDFRAKKSCGGGQEMHFLGWINLHSHGGWITEIPADCVMLPLQKDRKGIVAGPSISDLTAHLLSHHPEYLVFNDAPSGGSMHFVITHVRRTAIGFIFRALDLGAFEHLLFYDPITRQGWHSRV